MSQETRFDPRAFVFDGEQLHYNLIRYNHLSERAVEVPLGLHFLAKHLGLTPRPGTVGAAARARREVESRSPGLVDAAEATGPRAASETKPAGADGVADADAADASAFGCGDASSIARRRASRVLEVGNTLRHYENELSWLCNLAERRIIDKFETYPGVEQLDVMELERGQGYDLILCLSTVEHIGQHTTPDGQYGEAGGEVAHRRDRFAPLGAIARIYDLLAEDGRALITVPFGRLTDGGWWIQFSRPYLNLLKSHFDVPEDALSVKALKREQIQIYDPHPSQRWVQTDTASVADTEFNTPGPHANAIAVIELRRRGERSPSDDALPELEFATPIVIGSVFYNHFAFNAHVDSQGLFQKQGPGPVFFGPYRPTPSGRYDLAFELDIVKGAAGLPGVEDGTVELNLTVHADRGRQRFFSRRIHRSTQLDYTFLIPDPVTDLEISLENRLAGAVHLRVSKLVLRRRQD